VPAKGSRTPVKVTFHATAAGAKFQCKVDGGAWKACTSAWKPRLKVGKHVLQVRALVGTAVDATPAKARVRIVTPS
jgi:cytochrome c5